MSYIHGQYWVLGTPKCCAAGCQRVILDYSQAVIVMHGQESTGFCSLHCFREAFRPAAALPPAQEPSEEHDLLHALGYCYPQEERTTE